MRIVLLILALFGSAFPAYAQLPLLGAGAGSVAGTYTGPGDIVSGATNWYSVSRAYSGSYAASLGNAMTVRRASDNTTQTIAVLSTGAIDVATAITFAGIDATCTGTIAGTTLTCTGASSTPHAKSTVTGTGITPPLQIVSCGTFTGGAGTCTLGSSATVSSPETITVTYALYVTQLNDESGGGNSAPQAITGSQPQWFSNCGNGKPCVYLNNGPYLVPASGTSVAQPFSFSVVAEAFNNGSGNTFSSYSAGNGAVGLDGAANTWDMYGGSTATFTATDNAWHSIKAVLNGASSHAYVDGTTTNSLSAGTSASSTQLGVGANTDGSNPYNSGFWAEGGQWPVGFTGTTNGNSLQTGLLCKNEQAYYGLTGC